MARKKTKRRAQQPASIKSRPGKLDRVFTCPVCHHERSVECKLDRQRNIGILFCRVCGVEYKTEINLLSQAIDVYSDWIDAFASANP